MTQKPLKVLTFEKIPLNPPFSKWETGKGGKIIASPFEKGRQERDFKKESSS